jgi:hypothetical protein
VEELSGEARLTPEQLARELDALEAGRREAQGQNRVRTQFQVAVDRARANLVRAQVDRMERDPSLVPPEQAGLLGDVKDRAAAIDGQLRAEGRAADEAARRSTGENPMSMVEPGAVGQQPQGQWPVVIPPPLPSGGSTPPVGIPPAVTVTEQLLGALDPTGGCPGLRRS